MENETPPVDPKPTLKDLETPLPPVVTKSEKEVFEGRIKELEDENAELKKKLEERDNPKPEPKKKHFLERFAP